MKSRILLSLLFYTISTISAFSAVKRERDIPYANPANGTRNLLDVYYKKGSETPRDVIVFIHGGSWNSGKKDIYWWLGRNFARKNVVTVIINYGLAPAYKYEQMAVDCAAALKWVKNNIRQYGGNPERIFVMGHSAGGHLAALINSDPRFFEQQKIQNPIYGIILNDAFGLDMHEYLLTAEPGEQTASFLKTFSTDPEIWNTGSPFTYIKNIHNPHLILVGGRTYPSIQIQSKRLYEKLKAANKPVQYQLIKNKKHIGMITQMIFGCNRLYKTILDFMDNTAGVPNP